MALPWLAIAKAVPWSDVIEHAPSVVNAARKLMQRKPAEPSGGTMASATGDAELPTPLTVAELATQLRAAQADAAGLRSQLAETQLLLQQLAEQHARTLVQVEDNRNRIAGLHRRLLAVAVVAAVGGVVALGLLAKSMG